MCSLKKQITSLLATLCFASLPALAFADVCDQINFARPDKVYDQVTSKISKNDTVTAKDAACILKKVQGKDRQEKVGTYLAKHLDNPNKLDTMLNAVKDKNTRSKIQKAADDYQKELADKAKHDNHHDGHGPNMGHDKVVRDLCGQLQLKKYKENNSPYVQTKRIVKDDDLVMSSDVACIMKQLNNSQQEKVGTYLAPKLADPENADQFLKLMNNKNAKNKVQKLVRVPEPPKMPTAPIPPAAGKPGAPTAPIPPAAGKPGAPMPPMGPGMAAPIPQQPVPSQNIANDISSKIDYSNPDNVLKQVQLYLGNKYIQAADAKRILEKVPFSRVDKDVALYLISRIADYENAYIMLKEVDDPDALIAVANEGYQDIMNHPKDMRYRARVVSDIHSKMQFVFDRTYVSQVKYLLGNDKLYASDAAEIIKNASPDTAIAIGNYVIPRLADPDNLNLLLNATPFSRVKDALVEAAMKN